MPGATGELNSVECCVLSGEVYPSLIAAHGRSLS